MDSFPQPSYLVRMLYGEVRAQVFRLRAAYPRKQWYFTDGVAVVDSSLSEALYAAQRLVDRGVPA